MANTTPGARAQEPISHARSIASRSLFGKKHEKVIFDLRGERLQAHAATTWNQWYVLYFNLELCSNHDRVLETSLCITFNTPPTNRAPFSNWDLWLLITINDFKRNEFKFNITEYANRNSEAQSAEVKLIVCAIISQPINENGMHAIHIGAELWTRVIDRQFINTALYANCSAYILNILDVMRTKKQF